LLFPPIHADYQTTRRCLIVASKLSFSYRNRSNISATHETISSSNECQRGRETEKKKLHLMRRVNCNSFVCFHQHNAETRINEYSSPTILPNTFALTGSSTKNQRAVKENMKPLKVLETPEPGNPRHPIKRKSKKQKK